MTFLRAFTAAVLIAAAGAAQAADLDAVHASLAPLRKHAEAPGATLRPEFLTARDQLHDWIQIRLKDLKPDGDAAAFSKKLNAEIAAADLACIEAKDPGYNRCSSPGDVDARGYVGAVDIARVQNRLIVQAELGVTCGFDEALYIYEWVKDRWAPKLDTRQVRDPKGVYLAAQIQQVLFGRAEHRPADEILVVATGAHPTCGAGFRPVHYRMWDVRGVLDAGATVGAAVDGREMNAYFGRRDPAVSARLDGTGVVVEMDVASIDPQIHSRTAVRRFVLDSRGVRRMPPFALTPRDFVEEWLRAPWSTASTWTKRDVRAALEKVHAEANAGDLRARFIGPTQRCETDDVEDVVQVGVRFPNGERFFRLKNDPAGAYELRAIDSTPAKNCVTRDSSLDARRTLFQ